MRTWGELLEAVDRAIETRDFEHGEGVIQQMSREAGLSGDLGQEGSCLFYEGMFAEAKGELDRAEGCFAHLVDVDRRLHGPAHPAVGDALNSLAIVQGRAGKHDASAQTMVTCAEVYDEAGSPHSCSTFVRAGEAMLGLGRPEEAQRLAERALVSPPSPDGPWRKLAAAVLDRAFVARKLYRESFLALARASREPLEPRPDHREAQAQIWCAIGHVSIVFGLTLQAATAYASALLWSEDERLRTSARRGLEEVGAPLDPPLDVFRVVHVDGSPRRAHVMHIERGLFVIDDPPDVELGATVVVDETRSPTSIERIVSSTAP